MLAPEMKDATERAELFPLASESSTAIPTVAPIKLRMASRADAGKRVYPLG